MLAALYWHITAIYSTAMILKMFVFPYEIVKEQKIFVKPIRHTFWPSYLQKYGDGRGRTGGLLLAKQTLYQLSYIPRIMGTDANLLK